MADPLLAIRRPDPTGGNAAQPLAFRNRSSVAITPPAKTRSSIALAKSTSQSVTGCRDAAHAVSDCAPRPKPAQRGLRLRSRFSSTTVEPSRLPDLRVYRTSDMNTL